MVFIVGNDDTGDSACGGWVVADIFGLLFMAGSSAVDCFPGFAVDEG